jgi:hypothetical protein
MRAERDYMGVSNAHTRFFSPPKKKLVKLFDLRHEQTTVFAGFCQYWMAVDRSVNQSAEKPPLSRKSVNFDPEIMEVGLIRPHKKK